MTTPTNDGKPGRPATVGEARACYRRIKKTLVDEHGRRDRFLGGRQREQRMAETAAALSDLERIGKLIAAAVDAGLLAPDPPPAEPPHEQPRLFPGGVHVDYR